jgi:uncharacterized protein (TIGR03083 family)
MSSDAHLDACLSLLRAQSAALANDLRSLSPAALDGPTNCPPWRVRDVAAHVVSSGEGFVDNIRNGLGGSVDPPAGSEERQRRRLELESAEPQMLAGALEAVTLAFERLYQGLQEDQLEVVCYHRRGNRSVRWYAAHRLAEVAFHAWDVQFSLGRSPVLDQQVAALLLPTLLESNAPRTYAAGLTAQRGDGERYLLAVEGDPELRWLVTIQPDRLETQRVPPTNKPTIGALPADLTISASAANLALLVYGRADLDPLSKSGAAHLEGDPEQIERFAQIFPRP